MGDEELPKVRLVALDEILPSGTTLEADGATISLGGQRLTHEVFKKIYSGISDKDLEHFSPPTSEELEVRRKMGHTYFAILDDGRKEIVGATRAAFRDIPKKGIMMRIFYPPYKGLIGRTFILQKFRRQNYGQASKAVIEKMAKEKGIKTLRAVVEMKNKNSIGALKKSGFKLAFWRSVWLQPDNLHFEPKKTLSGNPHLVFHKNLRRRK